MQIEVKLDATCRETKVVIVTDKITDEIHALISQLSADTPTYLPGFQGDQLTLLRQSDVLRIYGESGKVWALTQQGKYLLRLRLYALEERLNRRDFVRISNSEILNLRQVKAFDLRYTGTICVSLSDGSVTYVSRRYVGKIKEVLGI